VERIWFDNDKMDYFAKELMKRFPNVFEDFWATRAWLVGFLENDQIEDFDLDLLEVKSSDNCVDIYYDGYQVDFWNK